VVTCGDVFDPRDFPSTGIKVTERLLQDGEDLGPPANAVKVAIVAKKPAGLMETPA
jgi:hypothetical protein